MPGLLERLWSGPLSGAWAILIPALALYGLIAAAAELIRLVTRLKRVQDAPRFSILVLVYNQEHQIEGFVRNLAAITRSEVCAAAEPELLLIDLNSGDETPQILQRLVRQHAYMRLIQVQAESGPPPCDTALVFCQSPVALLIDLRGRVDANQILQGVSSLFQKKGIA